jgi:hypothetical protein
MVLGRGQPMPGHSIKLIRRSADDVDQVPTRTAVHHSVWIVQWRLVMTVNVGWLDRLVRTLVGVALIAWALGYLGPVPSWGWVGWIGVVPILTGAFGFCPIYSALGISTCKEWA